MALMEATSVTGPAKNLIEFARRASRHGVEITVTTFERAGAGSVFAGAVRSAGVPVRVIAERRRFDPGILPALRAAVAEYRPDIVQSHNVKSHFLVRLLGLHRGRPWIAFHHGYTAADYRRLDRWSLPAAARVVAVCNAFAGRLREMGVRPERISVRHNMVAPFAPAGAAEVAELRARLGVPEGARVLLSVGRLSLEKGHADLLDAAAIVRRQATVPFRVVLLGEGDQREALERKRAALELEDCVILAGHHRDVRPFYSLADVAALPSHSEGSPNALLEAMAAGLPVAAAAAGGVPEIATDRENALLVPPRDPAAMAAALLGLLGDPALAARLGAAARVAAAACTPEAYSRSMLDTYGSVLGRVCGWSR